MSTATAAPVGADQNLALLFQYTVEAYKTFQKLAEMLRNPLTAEMFAGFARDERGTRDLLEIKYARTKGRLDVTLGGDLRFQDMLEGDLSYREITEFLIGRERSMERKLIEVMKTSTEQDRNLYHYVAASKRAHLAFLEREAELIQLYPDWFKREDAESVVVLGEAGE